MTPLVMPLACQCNASPRPSCIHGASLTVEQNYPWGKKGKDSLSARLCAQTSNTGFKIDESKEYAEMWMGDYPVLPDKILEAGEELHKVIDENQEQLLGKNCIEKFGECCRSCPR